MNEKIQAVQQVVKSNYGKAKQILEDKVNLDQFLSECESAVSLLGIKGKQYSDTVTLVSMLRSYSNGSYKEVNPTKLTIGIIGLLYVILPFDLIPDSIPVVGKLDDTAVVGFVNAYLSKDISKYRRWRDDILENGND